MKRRKTLTRGLAFGCATLAVIGCTADAPTKTLSAGGDPLSNRAAVAAPPELLASGLEGASGSAIGPGQALFVTEGAAGRISRVDPKTGEVTNLPTSFQVPGNTAYVVTLTGEVWTIDRLAGPPFGAGR